MLASHRATAAAKKGSGDSANPSTSKGKVQKPESRLKPSHPTNGERPRLAIYSYITRVHSYPHRNETTRRHWVLFLHTGPGGEGYGQGLLHDVLGSPHAFYQRRLRDVQPAETELGVPIQVSTIGHIDDVERCDRIVSATRIDNRDPSYHGQHWVHEAVERRYDNAVLPGVDWDRLEAQIIGSLEEATVINGRR
jgi:hypothetical protein